MMGVARRGGRMAESDADLMEIRDDVAECSSAPQVRAFSVFGRFIRSPGNGGGNCQVSDGWLHPRPLRFARNRSCSFHNATRPAYQGPWRCAPLTSGDDIRCEHSCSSKAAAHRVPRRSFREHYELVARRATCDHEKRRTKPVLFWTDIPRRYWKEGLFLGGRTRARTWDPMIKSHLLYQLSYAPGNRPGKPSQEGVV
jgi:hypothetical protein